jgi:hypothetical protein
MNRPFYNNPVYISAVSMGATITGDTINLGGFKIISAVYTVTSASSPVGDLTIQMSNDKTTWIATAATVAISGNTTGKLEVVDTGAAFWRVVYTRTSGSATLTVSTNQK